jgi:uncharacterized repeat protein (TIGR02543 family)
MKKILYVCALLLISLSLIGCQSDPIPEPEVIEKVRVYVGLSTHEGTTKGFIDVPKGSKILQVIQPEIIVGHTFVQFENSEGLPITEDDVVNEITTIYVIYTVNEHTLYFHSNGGSEIPPMVFRYTQAVQPNKYIPTKEGYTFVGWYGDEALTKPISIFFAEDYDVHLYAKWTPNE